MDRTVLVIDQDPLVRNLISNLLDVKGYRVDQAVTRDEAVSLLTSADYDLVLLDLMLPDDDGFALLEHIRLRFPRQSKYTVVMTSADKKFASRLPEEGWCAILIKPFAIAEFYRVIDLCLQGSPAAGLSSE